jgi:hypothetical protein
VLGSRVRGGRLMNLILDRLQVMNPMATADRATAVFGMMLACLQLSRVVTGAALSDFIPEAGAQGAMALSGAAR